MRRLLPVLLCLAVAPVVAGCGSDDVKDLAGGDVATAAERTAAQKTARMTMRMEMRGIGLPGTIRLDASGVMDLTKPRGTMTLNVPQGLAGKGGSFDLLFDGGTLYAELPEAVRTFTDGKRWVKADVVAIAKQLGIDVGAMNPSPSAQLELLRSMKGLKEVGPRHFKGTFELPVKLLDQKVTAELWLDENGLARELRSKAPLGNGGEMSMTFKLSDFGAELKLDPPSADETFELTGDTLSTLLAGALTS